MLGIRLNNISADVIFCVWGQYIFFFFLGGGGWLRTKCSCEVHHKLQIMLQSFVFAASPPTPEQDWDIHSLVNVLCFYFYIVSTMRRKCRGLIDLDKHGSAV